MGRKENITLYLTEQQRSLLIQMADACGITASHMVELILEAEILNAQQKSLTSSK